MMEALTFMMQPQNLNIIYSTCRHNIHTGHKLSCLHEKIFNWSDIRQSYLDVKLVVGEHCK